MKLETTIAKHIHAAGVNAAYDAACKRLLSEKSILAWIMKECLLEYQDCTVEDIAEKYIEGTPQIGQIPVAPDETMIHGTTTEDVTIHEGTVTYDIRFYATVPNSDETIRLIVNLEAQSDYYPGYPLIKRALYYCSRMISSQYGTEFTQAHYEKIKKVYSIWICMNPPKNRENSITRYRVTEENIAGAVKEKLENYDLLSVIMLCLGSIDQASDNTALKLLEVLLSTQTLPTEKKKILQEDFHIQMSKPLESEVSVMCNLSKGVEDRGIEKGIKIGIQQGMQQGIQQGMQQGMQQGSVKATLSALQNLICNMHISLTQAMDALGIPQEEREEYENLLKH